MVVRGEYPEALARMVEETNKKMDAAVGWSKFPEPPVIDTEAIRTFAYTTNPWNPLYYDENYAAGTRWGGLIAYPMYQNRWRGNTVRPVATPECGLDYQLWPGQDWEFYKPIRPGDTLKVWNRRPQLRDVTSLDGKGPHTFALMSSDSDHINQRDELVSTLKNYTYRAYYPEEVPKPPVIPKYEYTQEELEYLDALVREEEVRGANPRYWEDVNIGDETRPVVLGPTYMGDNANTGSDGALALSMQVPPRELLQKRTDGKLVGDFIQNPETGLWVRRGGGAGRHWSDLAAQAEIESLAFLYGVLSIYTMLRCITNWMGDDGFITVYRWRHIMRTPVGDALVGRGRVINKRVESDGYLVDLDIWLENLRGNISETALTTISLLSKEAGYKWK